MSEPKKWWQVYPQSTPTGNEEQRFFKALARHPKFDWRSVAAISADSGLPPKRVEEIIAKYFKLGIVLQNPKNEDHWGYWENHKKLVPKPSSSIAEKDTKKRVSKLVGKGASPSPQQNAQGAGAQASKP